MTLRECATALMSARFASFMNGLSENENAAMRALMLIGANPIGIDLTLVADDLRLTVGAQLPLEIYDRLLAMLSRVDHDAVLSGTQAPIGARPRHAPAELVIDFPYAKKPSFARALRSDDTDSPRHLWPRADVACQHWNARCSDRLTMTAL